MLQKLPKNSDQSQEKFSAKIAIATAVSVTTSWSTQESSNTRWKKDYCLTAALRSRDTRQAASLLRVLPLRISVDALRTSCSEISHGCLHHLHDRQGYVGHWTHSVPEVEFCGYDSNSSLQYWATHTGQGTTNI